MSLYRNLIENKNTEHKHTFQQLKDGLKKCLEVEVKMKTSKMYITLGLELLIINTVHKKLSNFLLAVVAQEAILCVFFVPTRVHAR
ncbi:MAG: hypothetical protein CVV02_08980 [Firmicutes bacterium HGW-Firmicutes-7]|nr:MAG: hypothetical protein CVV02_08980 [Firmicutes bacterium HGW-Firmicutes-7]